LHGNLYLETTWELQPDYFYEFGFFLSSAETGAVADGFTAEFENTTYMAAKEGDNAATAY